MSQKTATVFVLKSGGYLIDIDNHRGILYYTAESAMLAAFELFAAGIMPLEELNKINE